MVHSTNFSYFSIPTPLFISLFPPLSLSLYFSISLFLSLSLFLTFLSIYIYSSHFLCLLLLQPRLLPLSLSLSLSLSRSLFHNHLFSASFYHFIPISFMVAFQFLVSRHGFFSLKFVPFPFSFSVSFFLLYISFGFFQFISTLLSFIYFFSFYFLHPLLPHSLSVSFNNFDYFFHLYCYLISRFSFLYILQSYNGGDHAKRIVLQLKNFTLQQCYLVPLQLLKFLWKWLRDITTGASPVLWWRNNYTRHLYL